MELFYVILCASNICITKIVLISRNPITFGWYGYVIEKFQCIVPTVIVTVDKTLIDNVIVSIHRISCRQYVMTLMKMVLNNFNTLKILWNNILFPDIIVVKNCEDERSRLYFVCSWD
jgi:hypothetical protein